MRKGTVLVAALLGWLVTFTAATPAAVYVKTTDLLLATAPTNDDVAKAVLKAIGALILHEQSKPQPNDELGDTLARAIAKAARDKLIDSALEDLSPTSKPVERASVRNLVILALDGKLSRDRDKVTAYLRQTNPDMADVVEITEFLIQLSQARDKARK